MATIVSEKEMDAALLRPVSFCILEKMLEERVKDYARYDAARNNAGNTRDNLSAASASGTLNLGEVRQLFSTTIQPLVDGVLSAPPIPVKIVDELHIGAETAGLALSGNVAHRAAKRMLLLRRQPDYSRRDFIFDAGMTLFYTYIAASCFETQLSDHYDRLLKRMVITSNSIDDVAGSLAHEYTHQQQQRHDTLGKTSRSFCEGHARGVERQVIAAIERTYGPNTHTFHHNTMYELYNACAWIADRIGARLRVEKRHIPEFRSETYSAYDRGHAFFALKETQHGTGVYRIGLHEPGALLR